MRRALEILLTFTRDTRHQHPHLMSGINNYGGLLVAMGNTQAEAAEKIRAMQAQYAVSISGAVPRRMVEAGRCAHPVYARFLHPGPR